MGHGLCLMVLSYGVLKFEDLVLIQSSHMRRVDNAPVACHAALSKEISRFLGSLFVLSGKDVRDVEQREIAKFDDDVTFVES